MDRLACFFMTARSLDDLDRRIKIAEDLGYHTAGLPQIAARDALVTIASIGRSTDKIRLGTGVIPIWTRTPVALAQESAVVQEATHGRFILGIGVGHPDLIGSWHGTTFRKPLEAMRDYLTILRSALRTGGVDHKGSMFKSTFSFMGYQPSDVPIYIAALSPKMLQLAGELADGVILWMSTPHHVENVVLPNLRIGAERAGRDVSELEIFGCLFAAPGPDRASARNAVRQQLFMYLQLPFYRPALVESGFGPDLEAFDEGMRKGLMDQGLAGLSDRMIDQVSATGSPEQVAETLDKFVEAGCTLPAIGITGRYEGYQGAEQSLAQLREAASLVG
jgi:probable F420-dependent oxidoreductase